MTYRGPWNAASVRHRQTPRRYKAVGPVGEKRYAMEALATDFRGKRSLVGIEPGSCGDCGYHVCSCEKLPERDNGFIGMIGVERCNGCVGRTALQAHYCKRGECSCDECRAYLQPQLQAGMQPVAKRIADEVIKQALPEPTVSVEYIRADGTALVRIGERLFKRSYVGNIFEHRHGCLIQATAGDTQYVQTLIAGAEATHRASVQPQGGTAADGAGVYSCRVEAHDLTTDNLAAALEAMAKLRDPQGAATPQHMRYGCVHVECDSLGCEVCDPLAKVRQASERVNSWPAMKSIEFFCKRSADYYCYEHNSGYTPTSPCPGCATELAEKRKP